ncbi:hypothetical protein M407DRAFT_216696 [Tulasnella calospora MUT 4182]|uniref:Uncharacterized protein n=1 Tax=Tulasnella calospora MUT 4182 TaxID=1051891 RepID=A0A0C3KLN8_9AGAM|nr:hypothetical protein M407DRAFT_216696 [Tulasnella calospora MUT 4182]
MSDSNDSSSWDNIPPAASGTTHPETGSDQNSIFMQTYTARRRQILDVLNVLTSLGNVLRLLIKSRRRGRVAAAHVFLLMIWSVLANAFYMSCLMSFWCSNIAKKQFKRWEIITKKKIESICQGEDRPCTQNEDYFFHYRSKLLVKYKAIYQGSKGHGSIFGLSREDPHNVRQLVNEAIAALTRLNIHGLKSDNLVKLFPENKMDPALEIMSEA